MIENRLRHVFLGQERRPDVFSGAADPVHGEEANLKRLLKRYRPQVARLEYRLYPEGRHEMFNETNRDDVIADLLKWLSDTLPAPASRP